MASSVESKVNRYAAWAMLPDDVSRRIKKVMEGLREEFGGPEIEPHIPLVGSIHSTDDDVVKQFRDAGGKIGRFNCEVARVATSPCQYYYHCVYLFIDPTDEEINRGLNCFAAWFQRVGNMPHLSLLYGDLTAEEKEKAKALVGVLDDSIVGLRFTIQRIALYKCNDDRTQQSWEKIAEVPL